MKKVLFWVVSGLLLIVLIYRFVYIPYKEDKEEQEKLNARGKTYAETIKILREAKAKGGLQKQEMQATNR